MAMFGTAGSSVVFRTQLLSLAFRACENVKARERIVKVSAWERQVWLRGAKREASTRSGKTTLQQACKHQPCSRMSEIPSQAKAHAPTVWAGALRVDPT